MPNTTSYVPTIRLAPSQQRPPTPDPPTQTHIVTSVSAAAIAASSHLVSERRVASEHARPSGAHLRLGPVRDGGSLGRRLEHHTADVVDALSQRVTAARDGDGALGGVGQHLTGHLDAGAGHLSDLLDLGAALADQRAALRGWHDQTHRDWRLGYARAATLGNGSRGRGLDGV